MQNVSELFDLWPTDADLGRDIGVSYPAVAAWKRRGSIPAGYWRSIVRAARRRGLKDVTADLLLDLHSEAAAHDLARAVPGFRDVGKPGSPGEGDPAAGHFTRFEHLRRSHFASSDEIVDHVRALREEWDRR